MEIKPTSAPVVPLEFSSASPENAQYGSTNSAAIKSPASEGSTKTSDQSDKPMMATAASSSNSIDTISSNSIVTGIVLEPTTAPSTQIKSTKLPSLSSTKTTSATDALTTASSILPTTEDSEKSVATILESQKSEAVAKASTKALESSTAMAVKTATYSPVLKFTTIVSTTRFNITTGVISQSRNSKLVY